MSRILVLFLAVLSACGKDPPVAPVSLARPASWVLKECDPLPDIPKNDGDPSVRRDYHKVERPAYVECAAKHRELVRYVDTVAPQTK